MRMRFVLQVALEVLMRNEMNRNYGGHLPRS